MSQLSPTQKKNKEAQENLREVSKDLAVVVAFNNTGELPFRIVLDPEVADNLSFIHKLTNLVRPDVSEKVISISIESILL